MSNKIEAKDIKASPIYTYGPHAVKYAVRLAMVAAIATIFFSPAVILPSYLKAAGCTAPSIPCGQNAPDGFICVNGCTQPDNGANAPEMPALLVPLFIAAAGGMAYRIRRKNIVRNIA